MTLSKQFWSQVDDLPVRNKQGRPLTKDDQAERIEMINKIVLLDQNDEYYKDRPMLGRVERRELINEFRGVNYI